MSVKAGIIAAAIVALGTAAAVGEEGLRVLPEEFDGVAPRDMMKHYLLGHIDAAWQRWKDDYEKRMSPEDVAAYQQRLRGQFIEALGGFPERTPLNLQVVGTVQREGYRVEKVLFESQPKLYVTALLFLPDPTRFGPPYPGVLVPCGHALEAKGHDTYQAMGASLAYHGMAALVFDPIEQGERMQLLDEDGAWRIWGTNAHTQVGVGSILLGRNTATFEIWDGMRGIDYLESRPEVDADRIGCTGNSGGGTQTAYLMALDERIVAAAPSCYLNYQPRQLRTATGDAEQNIYSQLVFGLDHPDFIMLRAPKPTLICAATKDFFDIHATWETFRFAKRLYSRMGYAERVDLLENNEGHNYNELQRTGVLRWMARWLLGQDEPLEEPDITPLSEEEYQCTPRGQALLLEGARSTYDVNEAYDEQLAPQRLELWAATDPAELLQQVRRIANIRALDELPEPAVESAGEVERDGYRIEKLVLKPADGIRLPALLCVPEQARAGAATLYVNEPGIAEAAKVGGDIEALVKAGQTVLAVDLRGTGETQQTEQGKFGDGIGTDWEDYFKAYVLGRSYVGMRAEDVLVCARYLIGRTGADQVALVAVGNVGVPALHAAALEPQLFRAVKIARMVVSWSNVVHTRPTHNQLINAVHGALRVYDLPDLAKTLGDRLIIEERLDAAGREIE